MKDPSRMGAPQIIPGGIIEKAAAVPVSNVMVVCPTCNRPTRIGMVEKDIKGQTVRIRVCGAPTAGRSRRQMSDVTTNGNGYSRA